MSEPNEVPRRDQEPVRRWEDRCDFIRTIGTLAPLLVCDRPRDHRGMHTGRLIERDPYRVVGYGRLR